MTIDIELGTGGALCLESEVLCFGLFILGLKKLCIKEVQMLCLVWCCAWIWGCCALDYLC